MQFFRRSAARSTLSLIVPAVHFLFRLGELALKLKVVRTEVIREDNGTYAVACSALGVYSVGRTLKEAKRSFEQALDLHLSVVREKARKDLTDCNISRE